MTRSRLHFRNLAITALILFAGLSFAIWRVPVSVDAQGALATLVTNAPTSQTVNPGSVSPAYTFTLTNNSSQSRTFTLAVNGLPSNYLASFSSPLVVSPGAPNAANVSVTITVPSNATPGTTVNLQLSASSAAAGTDPAIALTSAFTLVVAGNSPTLTPSATQTNTPTPTTGPTSTPGPVCRDGFESDDDQGSARVIDVNTTQRHTICPSGDEDWVVFGGIKGKVFTIDVTRMDAGIDLSLELFDEEGRSLAFNDDFFDRNPPNPNDIRPRIQSFVIPADGKYYVRIRDTASRGGVSYFYEVALLAESYGVTPTNVVEQCLDLFEQDGLPEEARQINPNELQEDRRLCPTGDADWVKFFGKAGKRYVLFTDTRRYRGANQVNKDTQAGADTLLFLYDRDGVSPIANNDDIPGGNTLDSQVEFTPSVDGFYYAQVKNTGDIGNQFIRYDLTLLLCLAGQEDCVRPGTARGGQPTPPPPAATVGTPFTLPTDLPTATPTPTQRRISLQEQQAAAQAAGFADVAFQQLWQRSEEPVASGQIVRSWVWGPSGRTARDESYREAAGGTRRVQYFDKGRMEINDPGENRGAPWFVTSGLLVQELISGRMQAGNDEFVTLQPANLVVAGDSGDPNAPTYASLQSAIAEPAPDRRGRDVRETLERSGRVGSYDGTRRAESRLVRYIPQTGHNIPAAFWAFLTAQGLVYENDTFINGPLMDWESIIGYPISEPYWVRVNVGGVQRDVLVQAFQRRVLTYTPTNPAGWQVEMGNVGRHYYQWRYGEELP